MREQARVEASVTVVQDVAGVDTWDRPGDVHMLQLGDLALEGGSTLPDAVLAYQTWGVLSPARDNAVLVEHALTGDSHVVGPAGAGHPTAGWWEGLVGPGLAIDTDRFFVVAANVIGGCQGSTGPRSIAPDGHPWGSRFPAVTIRDHVGAERALADALGIESWALVVGGSMGGMRALEWAVMYPSRVARVAVLASTAAASADQIAWAQPQLLAIRHDPDFQGGDYYGSGRTPTTGLGIARRIAHTTYRSADDLQRRFGRREQDGNPPTGDCRYAVESYLDHHAAKLCARFDANSYLVLTEAMNSHDVGRGRGGARQALARVEAEVLVVAVDSDRLYPLQQSEFLAEAIPGARLATIASPAGHDAFLIEVDQVGRLLSDLLR
jgi:homoserine O-acetyltransferase